MPRKSSTLDEAVMLIQILTRIPKGRLITAQQLKQELDAAGIPIRIRTLQRYLKTMASTDVFGIDCDMRSRPYGYKQSTAGGTLLSQQMSVHECLLLRLAQEHMRFMIPTTLSKSLSPLFDMASQKFNETLSAAPRNEKAWLKKIAVVGSSLPMMPPKISRTIFEAVSEALFRELKLEIEYDSASGKQVKSLITPLGLVQQDVRLYLVCMRHRISGRASEGLFARLLRQLVPLQLLGRLGPQGRALLPLHERRDGPQPQRDALQQDAKAREAPRRKLPPERHSDRLPPHRRLDRRLEGQGGHLRADPNARHRQRHRTTGLLTWTEERFSAPSALPLRRHRATRAPARVSEKADCSRSAVWDRTSCRSRSARSTLADGIRSAYNAP